MTWRDRVRQAQGLRRVATGGGAAARALAVADSRSFVRTLFLASLANNEPLAEALRAPVSLDDLSEVVAASRRDRLQAWLDVGTAVGELRHRDETWVVRGTRAQAITRGDVLLRAHYRSMLEYQPGPYAELAGLLRGGGRTDLATFAQTIADVSLAATPFVGPYLRETIEATRPERALDVGCGSGVYMRVMLDADSALVVDGIDLAADVVAETRTELERDGYGARVSLAAADVRTWEPAKPYDLVTLINDVYYFPPAERSALYARVRGMLTPGGTLVVVSERHPGSIAANHLHFLLVCQDGQEALPERGEIEREVTGAGFTVLDVAEPVPTEPFLAVRAQAPPNFPG
jgi:protein-L-isoaspartate O-methyltransferase